MKNLKCILCEADGEEVDARFRVEDQFGSLIPVCKEHYSIARRFIEKSLEDETGSTRSDTKKGS